MRISIEDVHFVYPGGVEALRGVSLSIEPGERVAIVGQNGAGKTTLVKHLNGLLRPTRGRVRIGDWDTAQVEVHRLAQRVGYVFQNPDDQLFCRTVAEEVAFGPRNLGYTPEEISQRVAEALALAELEDKAEANPYDLSPSWRKMVALASVIAMDTPIVIFDEPTTGQDARTIRRIERMIEMLSQRGKTILTITHDIDFCAENFERVVVMGQGRVLLDGPKEMVLGMEAILAQTYVEPPQLTRLGMRLGFEKTVCTSEQFLETLRRRLDHPQSDPRAEG